MQDTLPFHRIFGVAQGDAEVMTDGETAWLEPGALAFVPRHTECRITACHRDTTIVACCIEGHLPFDTAALFTVLKTTKRRVIRRIPTLAPHSGITECLRGIEVLRELAQSKEWCELKLRELILVAGLCRGKRELAAFFQPVLQPRDNFEEFVRTNYRQAESVEHLARLAGMGLSTFKRRFSEVFDDSVHQWMMKQKAELIRQEIQSGNRDIQDLMARFGFHFHAHFNRFCHTYLGAAPSKLMHG